MMEQTIGAQRVDVAQLAAFGGFVLAAIGSVGTWISGPLASVSGMSGDGKIGLATAAVGLVGLLVRFRPMRGLAVACAFALLALGVYEAAHIHDRLAHATLFGVQVASVGWGVWVLIAGGALAAAGSAMLITRSHGRVDG